MNVGEKRRSQLGSCDYQHGEKSLLCVVYRKEIIRDMSLIIRLLHDEEQDLHFWFQDEQTGDSTGNGDSIYLQVQSEWQDDLDARISKSLFKRATSYVH